MKAWGHITAGEIVIEPIPYIEISKIDITEKENTHTSLRAEGKINVESRKEIDLLCQFGTKVIVENGNGTVLFCGVITEIAVEECADLLTVSVCAASYSILMDREKKTRPFHDTNKTIKQMIQEVIKNTSGAKMIMKNAGDKKIGHFIMQYEETDWEFIKRMASYGKQSVFPDSEHNYPACYIGCPSDIPDVRIEDDIPYTLNWSNQQDGEEISKVSGLRYMVNLNDRYLKLGECVEFKGTTLYVKSVHRCIEHSVLSEYYELCSKEGLDSIKQRNLKLAGNEVTGVVKGIRGDYVNVQITSDDGNGNGNACWFLYSTVYSSSSGSGWYCMPESGDKVRIRFPDADEKNAYAVSSVSDYSPKNKSSDRLKDYSVRYIRNKQGMEIIWSPDRVSISANGASLIDINQNGTIFLSADAKITIHSDRDVTVEAGNQVHINGGGGVRINCGAKAEINLDETGLIELKGNEIHTN